MTSWPVFQEGAFDEAVKGVDAIVHTASPCYTNADDPQGMQVQLLPRACLLLTYIAQS